MSRQTGRTKSPPLQKSERYGLPEMTEQSVTSDTNTIDDALRLLARMLAAGYLRVLDSRGGRRSTADSASNREKSLDLSANQSDELAMSARRSRRRV